MIDSESVVQMNDVNQSKEESEAEIEVGVQAIRDIKIEDTVVKDQVQVEELTKFEENEKLQVRLDGDKADSVEQVDQIRNHEVTSNISHIINTCEEYEKTGLMVLVTGNKLIVINDPYVFRLLVMGQLSHDISVMGLDCGLCQVEKASEDMLIQLYSFVSEKSNAKIKELLLKDQYIKYMGHLNIDDNGIVVASSWSNDSVTESNPRANGPVSGGDWRSAIDVFGFIKALTGFVVNDIIQGTTKRLESLHLEEVLMNKKSFEYAQLLDKLKVESGVTIDIALWKFEATKYYGFVTDALEHPNLIKSMIFGIFRTNCVVFIIESTTVSFEAGNSKDGQNHEHALIVFTLGMKQMIGCCNKMDATTKKYSKTVYGETVKEKPSYLKKVTILDKIPFIPISDFEDDNMIERSPLFSNLILYISCKSMIKTEELMLVKANSKVWLASLSAWAIIVNQHVIIKLGLVYKPFVIAFTTPMIENKDFDQKLVDVGSSVLTREFIFDKDVVNNKAKTFDEKHLFMSIVIVKVVSVYQNIGLFEKISISTTMVNDKVNEKFQVSKKTNPALRAAEQKISKVGFVIIKNCYVCIAASWITDTFNKAVKTTSDLGVCYVPSFVLRGLGCSAIVALQFFHAMYAKRCIILVVATVLLFILFQPPLSSSWASQSNHIKVAPQSVDGISINGFMASNSTWMSLLLILAKSSQFSFCDICHNH